MTDALKYFSNECVLKYPMFYLVACASVTKVGFTNSTVAQPTNPTNCRLVSRTKKLYIKKYRVGKLLLFKIMY